MVNTIAILGTGKLGKDLASHWARTGYKVLVASGSRQKAKELAATIRRKNKLDKDMVVATDPVSGVKEAELIVFCTPTPTTQNLMRELRSEIEGKEKMFLDYSNGVKRSNL